jgi:hypothetical protein
MFHNASKQTFKPEPQPSTSGTHVSAVLSLPNCLDLTYSEKTLLMSTYSIQKTMYQAVWMKDPIPL